MLAKKIIALVTIAILVISFICLANLVVLNKEYIRETSYPRFVVLLIIHLVTIGYIAVIYRLDQMKQVIFWVFLQSLNCTVLITFTEVLIFKKSKIFALDTNTKFSEPVELIYLNIYYLTYIFSMLTGFVLAIVLITFSCMQYVRQRKVRQCLQRNVTHIVYTQQLHELRGQVCPICLCAFKQDQQLSQISCKHTFHDSCLKQWIKVNSTCPNCRYNLFTGFNQNQVAEARQAL